MASSNLKEMSSMTTCFMMKTKTKKRRKEKKESRRLIKISDKLSKMLLRMQEVLLLSLMKMMMRMKMRKRKKKTLMKMKMRKTNLRKSSQLHKKERPNSQLQERLLNNSLNKSRSKLSNKP